ncbi:glycosyltransferase family A protein [uncultured Hoeflea sp.]|uniref:glycosyltransferase family 2 protein n=1 Tax=uncultured Hoeflea sp. TaxID=538666 RepID=UPI0030DCCAAB|tara:strand:+ start:1631 stop:2563 length:933 start_codon:yes stop_codon:yes gene_type:complete
MQGISVGIPVYNSRDTLERAIDSALSQTTDVPYEIIIVDDGSTDTTANIGLSYQLIHPDIVRLIRTNNKGVAAARNTIVENARYSHLTWLDADDYYYSHKLQAQYDALFIHSMVNHEFPSDADVMVFSSFGMNGKLYSFSPFLKDPVRHILSGEFRAYLWSSMVATQAYRDVGPFNEDLHRSEDTDWLLRYLKSGDRILVPGSEEPLMEYHFSTQRDGAKVEASFNYMMNTYGEDMKKIGIYDEYKPRRYWEISNFYHSNRKWDDMWRCRAMAAKIDSERFEPKLKTELAAISDVPHRQRVEEIIRSVFV